MLQFRNRSFEQQQERGSICHFSFDVSIGPENSEAKAPVFFRMLLMDLVFHLKPITSISNPSSDQNLSLLLSWLLLCIITLSSPNKTPLWLHFPTPQGFNYFQNVNVYYHFRWNQHWSSFRNLSRLQMALFSFPAVCFKAKTDRRCSFKWKKIPLFSWYLNDWSRLYGKYVQRI